VDPVAPPWNRQAFDLIDLTPVSMYKDGAGFSGSEKAGQAVTFALYLAGIFLFLDFPQGAQPFTFLTSRIQT
jgi:hypothetical protein